MNVQMLFEAARREAEQTTLVVVAAELERQGYEVRINEKYKGSKELSEADQNGELDTLPIGVGVAVHIRMRGDEQSFRLYLLDINGIALTDVQSPPVMYDPSFTTSEFRS